MPRVATIENGDEDIYASYAYLGSGTITSVEHPMVSGGLNLNSDPPGTPGGDGDLDETIYYAWDANRNVTALVNASGTVVERYVYAAYGQTTVLDADWSADGDNASDFGNEKLYCGYHLDPETGLYQVRNRYYHTTLGKWIGRDRVGYQDGFSLYAYGRGNPMTYIDPTGLWASDVHKDRTIQWAIDVGFNVTAAKKIGEYDDNVDTQFTPGLPGNWRYHFDYPGPTEGPEADKINPFLGDTRGKIYYNWYFEALRLISEDGNSQSALKYIGMSLHPLQDYYAHGNWNPNAASAWVHPDGYDDSTKDGSGPNGVPVMCINIGELRGRIYTQPKVFPLPAGNRRIIATESHTKYVLQKWVATLWLNANNAQGGGSSQQNYQRAANEWLAPHALPPGCGGTATSAPAVTNKIPEIAISGYTAPET